MGGESYEADARRLQVGRPRSVVKIQYWEGCSPMGGQLLPGGTPVLQVRLATEILRVDSHSDAGFPAV
ncbi:hypothetical protein BDM02DRAFT_3124673 [Thelephora ganbajun]|uniref:Uncharacterized protein n=1 Tax=Thelephora ganbajun TaxID=370292 RepID=A0ACB6YXZ3_THEGA|nr:hypothetical protein BDM02DRAFT_3124673 [Thelephora ganbajun]